MTYVHSNGDVDLGRVYDEVGAHKGNNSVEVHVTAKGNILITTGLYDEKSKVYVGPARAQEIVDMILKAIELSTEIKQLYTDVQVLKQQRLNEILGVQE